MSKERLDGIVDGALAYDPNKSEEPLKVIAGAQDRPLVIGDIEIPCYVLEDETRVLSQRGVFSSIGATRGGARSAREAKNTGAEIPRFATQNWIKPYILNDLSLALKSPIRFRLSTGATAYGYPATMLADICDVIVEADKNGATTERQSGMVERALQLIRGFARVGIVALVDEATGYQRVREERALATILEKFISRELQPWTKTFPFEFYEQICRLRGWPSVNAIKRPSVIGKYTNDSVYERLAPGVLDELRKVNPVVPDSGRRRHRHHQWFTSDLGHPKLKEHLAGVIALMRVSSTWEGFRGLLQKAYPKAGEISNLDFDGS